MTSSEIALINKENLDKPEGKSELANCVTVAEVNEEVDFENTKTQLEEQNEALKNLFNNVNYGIILSFFDKFSIHLGLSKEITIFKNLESSLTNKKILHRKLIDFHINLLKNLHCGRHVKKDKWEYYLAKYVGKYALNESLYIEQNGYLSLDIDLKLSIIKNLLESQFDENMKFKQILAEQITDLNSLRSVTIGRDKDGVLYWFFMDKEYSIRIFSQNCNDNDCKSWKLIVKELSELKELIQKLSTEPSLITLRSSKRYLVNIEKEKKLKEKKLKEEEALKEELSNKEIKNEELCEEEKIEKSLDEIKKDDESNDSKEKAESPSESIDSPSVKSENDSKDITDVNSKSEEDSNDIKIKSKEENESSSSQIEIEKNDCNDNDLPLKAEDLNKTVINEETKMKEENYSHETANTKNTKLTVEENFDDYIEPIALRKSTRASAIKAQEIQQLQLRTPIKSPKKSSPLKKKSEATKKDLEPENIVDEDDIEEEEESNVRKSRRKKNTDEDQEFKPKLSKTPTKRIQAEENENKKSKSKKKKKQETESEEEEEEEDPNFDSSCIKCSKVKRNQILILCDGCDAAYHLICLKMDEVPDGDWFCTICEHDKLIKALEEKTELIENHFKEIELAKTKSIVKRTNRIADIGANLDNLFKNGTKKRNRTKDEENNDPNDDDEDESGDNSFRKRPRRPFEDFNKPVSNYFTNTEPVGPRSCRVKGKISYTFEDYDRTIKEAVGENVEQPKDSSIKIRSSKRTKSKVKKPKVFEDDDTEYEDEDEANSENDEDKNSSNASSSSEFEVKTKKKDFSESEEDCDDEKKFSDDDDDFRPSKSKKKIEHKNRRSKKAKKTSKIRTKRAKEDYDDEDDGVEDEDEDDEESDEDVSDEEESFRREVKKNKQLYSYERRSARNRKCLKESYCELDEDEEYEVKKKTKSKKIKDSEDDFSDELSEEDFPKKNKFNSTRRSNRAKKGNKKYNDDFDVYDDNDDDYKSYYEDDNDDEKSLNTNHRNNSETKKNKSRIKKLWSDDENSDSDGEKEKRSKKQVIIKPWEEDDEDEDEENEEENEEEEEGEEEKDVVKEDKKEKEKKEEKEEKIEQEENKVTQIIKDEKELENEIADVKETIQDFKNENDKNKKSNGDTIYSSSSSYSSSGSSTRSTSPVQHNAQPVDNKIIDKNDSLIDRLNKATNILNDVIKPKITNDNSINLNNEVLLKPTNFSSEKIVEKLVENKIEKTNNDSSSHSDVVKTSVKKKNKKLEEPNEIPKVINESNKTTISNDSNANNSLMNSQKPATVLYSPSQFVSMQSKTIQPLNSQSQVPFQLYNQADVNQKTQIINQTLPLNSFTTINNFGNVNYSQPGYPQLYYYYHQQQQQQQFNNQQVQPMMIQNPGTIITPNSIIPQTQPITFLQSYNNNSVAFNSQTSTNNLLPNYVTQPGYPIQPGTNLFQPHLINFSGGSAVNINMNGVSSLNQSSHQS